MTMGSSLAGRQQTRGNPQIHLRGRKPPSPVLTELCRDVVSQQQPRHSTPRFSHCVPKIAGCVGGWLITQAGGFQRALC